MIFPYTEAAFLGIGPTQHWTNIKNVIALGFLELIHQGGWYQKHEHEKDYSVYKMSERWRKHNTPEFITIEKPKALPGSFHIKENMERYKFKFKEALQRKPMTYKERKSLMNMVSIKWDETDEKTFNKAA